MKENIKILLVETDANDSKRVMNLLQEDGGTPFQVVHVRELKDALKSLSAEKFDIVLLDLALQDSGGLYTLTTLRHQNLEIPIIVINAPDDDSMAVQSIQELAQDYLAKNQLGKRILVQMIYCSIERMKLGQQLEQTQKVMSREEISQHVDGGLATTVTIIREKIKELKGVLFAPELNRALATELLNSTESAAKDFTAFLEELRSFIKEVPEELLKLTLDQKKNIHFLVADDEPELLELIAGRLHKLGFENVDCAKNGQQAYNMCIEKTNKKPFYDAIISDWKMPKLTGIELLEKVRNHTILKDTFFLMITAFDEVASVKEAIDLKVSQYLVKPFRIQEFDRKISYLTKRINE
ncbi:MAG: hypothetical protein JWQ35_1282 [Bacteriovoracaceae bacterium]|nr:hypothetical protein [Bacteriovoracaceae bacterium]